MKKSDYKLVKLAKGEIKVYDFGKIQLYAYKTNDFLNDEVLIVKKNNNAVMIETPCFFDNINELKAYLSENKININAVIVSYHYAGGSFIKNFPIYSTKKSEDYGNSGMGKTLVDNFTKMFGKDFDNSDFALTGYITAGKNQICGIDFVINEKTDAFEIEILKINSLYTHMLGHNCHSIMQSKEEIIERIAELESYKGKGYDLILTSHNEPEDLDDVETKIKYLNRIIAIMTDSITAAGFKSKVLAEFKDYSGENYLDMSANYLFA